jgi:hypothetical protein
MSVTTATRPFAEQTITIGQSSVRPGDIESISFGVLDVSPPFEERWDRWGRVVLKSRAFPGARKSDLIIDCTRERAEQVLDLVRAQGFPLVWASNTQTSSRSDFQYFSADVVEAATPHRFLVAGQWHECHWIKSYASEVRRAFGGRHPKALKVPTQEGMVTCNPDVFEGYVGPDELGYGQVGIGGAVFSTRVKAVTRKVEVAAREAFAERWSRNRSRPQLPTKGRPAVGVVSR